ncbi:MAG: hypothetical protein LPH21_09305 [Shewanella sp.]|nr:hypothetical protein [Shewanella sp.]MCF1457739.1 hypothetical protein [Shewanella sp.]
MSWLSFNESVRQEASDASVPVVEQVQFLGIYSNNRDELFRVWVAAVNRRLQLGSFSTTLKKDRHLLQKIQTKVLLLQEKFDAIYAELMRCNIFLVNELQLTQSHSRWLKKHFRDNLKQYIAPLIINNRQNLTKLLRDDTPYLAVSLKSEHKRQYALIEIPTILRQTTYDPAVCFIKINVYRVAKHSQIMHSLMEAVKNGKKVTALIELAARFDEQANIEWSRRLSETGVRGHHGIPSLKIHAKMCLIGQEQADDMHLYAPIGTGNFNESTARIYSDFALLTAHQEIGADGPGELPFNCQEKAH